MSDSRTAPSDWEIPHHSRHLYDEKVDGVQTAHPLKHVGRALFHAGASVGIYCITASIFESFTKKSRAGRMSCAFLGSTGFAKSNAAAYFGNPVFSQLYQGNRISSAWTALARKDRSELMAKRWMLDEDATQIDAPVVHAQELSVLAHSYPDLTWKEVSLLVFCSFVAQLLVFSARLGAFVGKRLGQVAQTLTMLISTTIVAAFGICKCSAFGKFSISVHRAVLTDLLRGVQTVAEVAAKENPANLAQHFSLQKWVPCLVVLMVSSIASGLFKGSFTVHRDRVMQFLLPFTGQTKESSEMAVVFSAFRVTAADVGASWLVAGMRESGGMFRAIHDAVVKIAYMPDRAFDAAACSKLVGKLYAKAIFSNYAPRPDGAIRPGESNLLGAHQSAEVHSKNERISAKTRQGPDPFTQDIGPQPGAQSLWTPATDSVAAVAAVTRLLHASAAQARAAPEPSADSLTTPVEPFSGSARKLS